MDLSRSTSKRDFSTLASPRLALPEGRRGDARVEQTAEAERVVPLEDQHVVFAVVEDLLLGWIGEDLPSGARSKPAKGSTR
jgi:hypothetical protein